MKNCRHIFCRECVKNLKTKNRTACAKYYIDKTCSNEVKDSEDLPVDLSRIFHKIQMKCTKCDERVTDTVEFKTHLQQCRHRKKRVRFEGQRRHRN